MAGEKTRVSLDGRELEVIPRELAERIVASRDREGIARMAYEEAFPNPAAYVNGQAVLDLATGEVRSSSYVEGHADDPGYGHLLTLMECEAYLKEEISEDEFVRAALGGRRPSAEEISAKLDEVYGSD